MIATKMDQLVVAAVAYVAAQTDCHAYQAAAIADDDAIAVDFGHFVLDWQPIDSIDLN